MKPEYLRLWISLIKFLIGTVALGIISLYINHEIQIREVEVREFEALGQFIEHALQENVGVRRRFAHYFSTVTQSDRLRERWVEYYKEVDKEYQAVVRRKEELEEAIRRGEDSKNERIILAKLTTELEVDRMALAPWKAARGDYLEVRRSANLLSTPNSKSEVIAKVYPGDYLIIQEEGQKNGYYYAMVMDGGPSGWIYRTFVRRYSAATELGGNLEKK